MIVASSPKPVLQRASLTAIARLQPHWQHALELLLAQDGSATRLCEHISGGTINLALVHQAPATDVPSIVRDQLSGCGPLIERVVSLHAHNHVMMDNLSYIALSRLPASAQQAIERGDMPLGHVLDELWVKRVFLPPQPQLQARLWPYVGRPDAAASRVYCVHTQQGPCMLIAETFRGGMLMKPVIEAEPATSIKDNLPITL